MRKYLVMTAIAGAIFSASATMPNSADAMAISTPAGMANAVADVDQVEQVRWVCGPFRCWWRPNYYPYYGFYRPYRPWGWRRRW